jgi:hypothetical protein
MKFDPAIGDIDKVLPLRQATDAAAKVTRSASETLRVAANGVSARSSTALLPHSPAAATSIN